MSLTDTPDEKYLAAVRRCGGRPAAGETQIAFAVRAVIEGDTQ